MGVQRPQHTHYPLQTRCVTPDARPAGGVWGVSPLQSSEQLQFQPLSRCIVLRQVSFVYLTGGGGSLLEMFLFSRPRPHDMNPLQDMNPLHDTKPLQDIGKLVMAVKQLTHVMAVTHLWNL